MFATIALITTLVVSQLQEPSLDPKDFEASQPIMMKRMKPTFRNGLTVVVVDVDTPLGQPDAYLVLDSNGKIFDIDGGEYDTSRLPLADDKWDAKKPYVVIMFVKDGERATLKTLGRVICQMRKQCSMRCQTVVYLQIN